MKIRQGFVSNSSSSSFIIAIDKSDKEVCPTCGRSDIAVLDLIKGPSNSDTEVSAQGYKNVRAEVLEWLVYDDNVQGLLDLIDKAHKEGKDLAYLSIDNEDGHLADKLRSTPDITILDGD